MVQRHARIGFIIVIAMLAPSCASNDGDRDAGADGRPRDATRTDDADARRADAPQATPPAAPTGVGAKAANGEIVLTWDAVTGADGYAIYWARAPGVTKSTCTQFRDIDETTFSHQGLVLSSTYHYAVTATRGGLESALSEEASASPTPGARPWDIGIVASAISPNSSYEWSLLSMARAPSGENQLVFFDRANGATLKHATDAGGTWTVSTIATVGASGSYLSFFVTLGIDSAGHAHVAFFDSGSATDPNHLRYATNASGTWVLSVIDASTNVGQHPSIVVDSSDKLHVAYRDYNLNQIKYATNASGAWVTATVDSNATAASTAIVVNANDEPQILYSRSGAIGELRHATLNGSGQWVAETIPGQGQGTYVTAAIDAQDRLHLAYFRLGTLIYLSRGAGDWVPTTIDNAQPPFGASIGVDSKGAAHIAYGIGPIGNANAGLRYATNAGGTWATATIDHIGAVGNYASLVLDANDEVQIAYGGTWPNYGANCGLPVNNMTSGYVKYASSVALPPAMKPAPPPPPQNVSGTASDTSLSIKWDCQSTPFINFNVYWSAGAGVTTGLCTAVLGVSADTPRYHLDGLAYGASYYFVVTAENSGGEGSPSVEALMKMPPAPTLPPDGGGTSGGCPTTRAQLCNCSGGTCFGGTISVLCECPSGTTKYGNEIGCAPGQSTGCIQCRC